MSRIRITLICVTEASFTGVSCQRIQRQLGKWFSQTSHLSRKRQIFWSRHYSMSSSVTSHPWPRSITNRRRLSLKAVVWVLPDVLYLRARVRKISWNPAHHTDMEINAPPLFLPKNRWLAISWPWILAGHQLPPWFLLLHLPPPDWICWVVDWMDCWVIAPL